MAAGINYLALEEVEQFFEAFGEAICRLTFYCLITSDSSGVNDFLICFLGKFFQIRFQFITKFRYFF